MKNSKLFVLFILLFLVVFVVVSFVTHPQSALELFQSWGF